MIRSTEVVVKKVLYVKKNTNRNITREGLYTWLGLTPIMSIIIKSQCQLPIITSTRMLTSYVVTSPKMLISHNKMYENFNFP